MRSWTAAALTMLSVSAWAEVGKVTQVEGSATRTPAGKTERVPLGEGAAIEVGDLLDVAAGANLAITLTDDSIIALSEGSSMRIDEARFGEQDSKIFSAKLIAGSLWSKVTKLVGSESKFEITTERAVAGVRGTIFTVDLSGADSDVDVGVEEGEVEVAHGVEEAAAMAKVGVGEAKAALGDARALTRAAARFAKLERIAAGGAVTIGRARLARHAFAIRHLRMAAFVGKHRERWGKQLRREMKDLRHDMKDLRRDMKDFRRGR